MISTDQPTVVRRSDRAARVRIHPAWDRKSRGGDDGQSRQDAGTVSGRQRQRPSVPHLGRVVQTLPTRAAVAFDLGQRSQPCFRNDRSFLARLSTLVTGAVHAGPGFLAKLDGTPSAWLRERYLSPGEWRSRSALIDHLRGSRDEHKRWFACPLAWTRRKMRQWVQRQTDGLSQNTFQTLH